MTLDITYLFSESCVPSDSNKCLQDSPDWGIAYNCGNSIEYCSSYGKDMRRCCPDSCNTGIFTAEDCEAFNGNGTCIYPNLAQCHIGG